MLAAYKKLEAKNPTLLGRTYALMGPLFATFMALTFKKLEYTSTYSVAYISGISNILLAWTMEDEPKGKRQGIWPKTNEERYNVIFRAACSFAANTIAPHAIRINSIQMYMVLTSLSTTFSVILDTVFLGKRQPIIIWICSITAVLGVVICIDPGFLGFGTLHLKNINAFGIALGLAFAAKISVVRAFVAAKYISSSNNLFYNGIGAMLSGAFMTQMMGNPITLTGVGTDWTWILAYLIIYYPFQIVSFKSLKLEKNTSIVSILYCFNVIFSFIVDIVFMGKPFEISKLIGSLIVFFSVTISIWNKKK